MLAAVPGVGKPRCVLGYGESGGFFGLGMAASKQGVCLHSVSKGQKIQFIRKGCNMEYGFSEEQEMLQRTVRDFFTREYSRSLVREIEMTRQDYSRDVYRRMAADLGLGGLMIPEEYGGSGMGWVETGIVYEEMGRALYSGPHYQSTVLAAQALLALGSEAQKRQYLPRIASGEIIAVAAIDEEEGQEPAQVQLKATPSGDGYVLNGVKLFTPFAHLANLIIVAARTSPGKDARGVSCFLVEANTPGLRVTPMETMGGERATEIVLNNVRVSAANVLGPVNGGGLIFDVVDRGKTVLTAYLMGLAQQALDMSIDYSKQRVQFGVPIGSFQGLQWYMAETWTNIAAARWLSYESIWKMSEGIDTPGDRAMAQQQCRLTGTETTHTTVQLHGGLGIMKDFDMSLFYRRAKAVDLYMGDPDSKKDAIMTSIGL